ncbi:MAG: efflux RND transporter periplasmic adaptor subunit, partial [Pirellulaceae bacterium]
VEDCRLKPELLQKIHALLTTCGAKLVWVVTLEPQGQWSPPISLGGPGGDVPSGLDEMVKACATQAIECASLRFVEPSALPGHVMMATPVGTGKNISDVLIGLFPSALPQGVNADWVLLTAADAVAKWQLKRRAHSSQEQLASLSSFVNLTAALNQTDNRLQAGVTLVNELKSSIATEQVMLLLRNGRNGAFRLAAMAGVESFDRQSATTQAVEATTLGAEDEPVFWYCSDAANEQSGVATLGNLQNFCTTFDVPGCALLPLKNVEGQVFGWLLLGMAAHQTASVQMEKHFTQIGALVAGQLETVLKSQRTLTKVCADNLRQTLKKQWARKLGVAALLALLILCIPMRYKIPCDCQLQLTRRRFVAAPYEGVLDKTLVSSGDVVTAGQLLAQMDARQLRMQLSGLTADLESERKRRDSALARGNVAESQIARSEMARLESEVQLLNDRLQNTEIRSPIAGVVVSGDLDKAEGAPMETGQNLFEVGPLQRLLVEVNIPENEIQYARAGMNVKFEFPAFPFRTFQGEIVRIHPRAEVIEDASVFVAEIALDNESGELRPGMKGRARVVADRYPLGWNLFHGAFEHARLWLIW